MAAVLFDIDGTLLDSVDLHAEAWRKALAHFGHEVAFHEIRSQIGKGGDELLPVFLPHHEFESRGEEIERYRSELFARDYLPRVTAFPMVRELFLQLRSDGWQLALASSAKASELKIYKEIARVTDLLAAETSSDDAEKSKPYPDIFQAAAGRLGGLPAAGCVVVGDSPYDAQAAAEAGMRSIGFLCGGFAPESLLVAGYERLYQGPADLLLNYSDSVFFRERPAREEAPA